MATTSFSISLSSTCDSFPLGLKSSLFSTTGLRSIAISKHAKSFACYNSWKKQRFNLVLPRASFQFNENQPQIDSLSSKREDLTPRTENKTSNSMKLALSFVSAMAVTSILLSPLESQAAGTGGRMGGSTFKSSSSKSYSTKSYSNSSPRISKSRTNIFISPQIRTAPPIYGTTTPYFGGFGLPFFPIPTPPVVVVPVGPPPAIIQPSPPIYASPAPAVSVGIVSDGFPYLSLFLVFGGIFGMLNLVNFFKRNTY